jgi:hypothetical protein
MLEHRFFNKLLNVTDDERNRDVWASRLAAGHKAKVWTIDNVR